eukprot:jgi/Mesvir1/28462/Mv15884-RA.2
MRQTAHMRGFGAFSLYKCALIVLTFGPVTAAFGWPVASCRYIGEQLQRTSVAIETKGFTFCTSGKKRETLKGDATLMFYPHLRGLEQYSGVSQHLETEISTSKERNFSCIEFVDTPGLVDGSVQYPYPVEDCIVWLANHTDMILVFLDPMGKGLCERTMSVVEKLNKQHHEKMQFYMSKADEVADEKDRQRVLIQITQNLISRLHTSSHAFNLPTIYVPREESSHNGRTNNIPNAIEDLSQEITKCINMTVQKNLTNLKEDCNRVVARIIEVQQEQAEKRRRNAARGRYGVALMLLSWLVAALWLGVSFLKLCAAVERVETVVMRILPVQLMAAVRDDLQHGISSMRDHQKLMGLLYTEWCGYLLALFLVLLVAMKVVWRGVPVVSKAELAKLSNQKKYVEGLSAIREDLYKHYFQQLASADNH